LCLAKGLTGGILPLAATLCTAELFERFVDDDRSRALLHGHSFTANPIGCAVARASLALVRERDVPARLDAIGARIHARLADHLGPRAAALHLRRTGGIVALDRPDPGGYLAATTLDLRRSALDIGVLLRPLGNVLYALPPACTTDAQCDRIADAVMALSL
jgi:adenosylmethionine-8-amino-7-oxononanoate aminotransferase